MGWPWSSTSTTTSVMGFIKQWLGKTHNSTRGGKRCEWPEGGGADEPVCGASGPPDSPPRSRLHVGEIPLVDDVSNGEAGVGERASGSVEGVLEVGGGAGAERQIKADSAFGNGIGAFEMDGEGVGGEGGFVEVFHQNVDDGTSAGGIIAGGLEGDFDVEPGVGLGFVEFGGGDR